MLKYKDIRMLIVSILITVLCVFAMIYFIHDKMKFVIVILLFITTLPTMVFRYNAKVFDDSMMVYVFKGIAILPELIQFDDLISYEQVSKRQIILKHKKTSKLYILNADTFIEELGTKYKKYQNMKADVSLVK